MANETVSFEITANTQNAGKAITELQRKLNDIARIKTDDKGVKAQQKVFAQINKDLEGILEKEGQLGRHYNTYSSRAKRIETLTKEYEAQDAVLQKFVGRQSELQAKEADGTITPSEVNELSRVTATVNNLTENQANQLKKINATKRENEKLDRSGKAALNQIVSKYGEIRTDESNILGLKLEQVKNTEQVANAEGELDREINKTNSSLDKQAQSAKRAKSEFDKASNKSNRTKNVKQIVDETEDIEGKISEIEKRASHVLSQPMGPDKFDFGLLKNRRTELETLKRTIESIGTPKELHGIYDQVIRELDNIKRGEQALHKETQKTNSGIVESTKQTVNAAEEAEKRIQEVVAQANTALSQPAPEGPLQRDDLDRRIAQLQEIQATIKKLGIPPELKGQYNQIAEELIRLRQAKNELDKAVKTPIKPNVDTTEVKDLQVVLQETAATTSRIDEAMKTEPATNNIAELIRRLNELSVAKKTLEELNLPAGTDATYNKIIQLIAVLNGQVSNYKKQLTGVAEKHEKTKKSGTDFTKSVLSGVKSLKSAMSKLDRVGNKVKSSFNSMAHSMKSNFKHLITSITKYVLGFRSLFFLVRRLRKYIGEGIQNMAQFNDGNNHVNESITRLLSSLLYLKNAWATAFSPILQFVTPWLERLIDGVARAGNAVSRFIGSLLGQENVFQAVKVDAASYADNLDKAAGSAGNAADKTKKLTDRLAAFDDLNVLGVDRDPDATGSGGGGGSADTYAPDPNEMFEIVNVGREVLDKLKKMWDNADFTELGVTLRNKLLNALTDVSNNLDEFRDTAYNIGKSIITFFNGVLGDVSLWYSAGSALGKTVNVVSEFVRGMIENTKIDFGGGLASLINGFFAATDWEMIKDNIINFATEFKDNVISFLTTLNWDGEGGIFSAVQSLGTAIGRALNETLGDAEFMGSLGDALGKLVSAILITWKAILDQNDGDEIGNAIYEFFASLINAINWDTLAENLSGSLVLLLNAISTFSENLSEDDSFQQALSDFVENLDLDTIFEALGRNISSSTAAANSVGSALATTLASQDVADKFTTGLTALIGNIDINEMVSTTTEFLGNLLGSALADPTLPIKLAGAIVVGIGNALGDALIGVAENSDIENWWEHPAWAIVEGLAKGIHDLLDLDWASDAFANLLTSFCDFLGIHSPSTVFEEYGKNIIEGLLNGINSLVDTVMDPFTTLGNNLATKWDEIKGNAYEKWVGIKTNVLTKAGEIKDQAEEKFETLKTNLTNKWQEIKGNIYEKLVGIKTNMTEVFEQMGDAIKAPINTIIDIIEGMVNKAIDGINSLTSGLSALTDLGSEIANKIGMPSIPHLSQLPHITIPHLAQGAVIPPNREFMAVLGDQTSGTNIEAPLDTIKQAVAEVMANNGNAEMIQLLQQLITVVENKNLVIGDKEIGRANARYVKQQNIVRGSTF